jgi:hypothetical protein
MTYTVQELAQQYAAALLEFHELDLHVKNAGAHALRQDVAALREARDVMYQAQEDLNAACLRSAEMNYA